MHHSNACWRTIQDVKTNFSKLQLRTAQLDAIKDQIKTVFFAGIKTTTLSADNTFFVDLVCFSIPRDDTGTRCSLYILHTNSFFLLFF